MPPRNPELPEGTDHIINGAMDSGAGSTASAASTGGAGAGTGAAGGLSSLSGTAGASGTGSGTGTSGTTAGGATMPSGIASGTSGTSGTSNNGGGFVASKSGDDTGGTRSGSGDNGGSGSGGTVSATAQKIADAAKSQVSTLTDQATGKLREYADQGKERATSTLDEFAAVVDDAARQIDERLGEQYGEYAHKAAGAVTSLSQTLRGKTVDELLEDSRSLVRKSPSVAVGAAALLGFTLVRLIKAGLDEGRDVQFTPDGRRNIDFQPDTGGTSGRSA